MRGFAILRRIFWVRDDLVERDADEHLALLDLPASDLLNTLAALDLDRLGRATVRTSCSASLHTGSDQPPTNLVPIHVLES